MMKPTSLPSYWRVPGVMEICSVSTCINAPPEGWMNSWKHNHLGFFDTVLDARAVVGKEAGRFVLFGYRLLPRVFVRGEAKPYDISASSIETPSPSLLPIGYDAVSKSSSNFFECSPLSCNHMAGEIAGVNLYCLMDTLDEALSLATRFSIEEPEPGPYYVLEVLREPKSPYATAAPRRR